MIDMILGITLRGRDYESWVRDNPPSAGKRVLWYVDRQFRIENNRSLPGDLSHRPGLATVCHS